MLDECKSNILRAVVQEYISTGQPVGSSHVAERAGVRVSSATIRNEMVLLEQEGYLAQPHTSAGRVPTDKGYRLFVDSLTTKETLDHASVQQVGEFFSTAHGRLEELLRHTSTLLADITHQTSLVVGSKIESKIIRHVQVVRLSARNATVVVVMSNGSVESETILLADEIQDSHLATASAHLQSRLVNTPISGISAIALTNDSFTDIVCSSAVNALTRHREDESVFIGGAASLAQSFDATEVLRTVLYTLEQQYVVVSLVQDVINRGLTVAIGAEHGVQQLMACSVVVAPVIADGEVLGSIGVLGPTRMNYPQALATVEVVSDQLGRRLARG